MSDHDLRLAERAEDAHARSLERAEEAIRLYLSDAYWWVQDATETELRHFAGAVMRVLSKTPRIDAPDTRLTHLFDARRAAFTETAMRRARVED